MTPAASQTTSSQTTADVADDVTYIKNAAISTWFRVGGCAERFAEVATCEQLASCLRTDPELRVLGDGANLLVHDRGVSGLVVALAGEFRAVQVSPDGTVIAGAGARLPQVINACVRDGLAGIEGLVGIPASMGGAAVMNAGGAFVSIADVIQRVRVIGRDGVATWRNRDALTFGYRHSSFSGEPTTTPTTPIVMQVELKLTPDDPAACRERQLACMARKKESQPLRENSAGCCFKNPVLTEAISGIGDTGQRVSAGMLIDRAGAKGMGVGGATVSEQHANFIVTSDDATAADIIELMDRVADHVRTRFGVGLEREVVVWGAP